MLEGEVQVKSQTWLEKQQSGIPQVVQVDTEGKAVRHVNLPVCVQTVFLDVCFHAAQLHLEVVSQLFSVGEFVSFLELRDYSDHESPVKQSLSNFHLKNTKTMSAFP